MHTVPHMPTNCNHSWHQNIDIRHRTRSSDLIAQPAALRRELRQLLWEKAGVVRHGRDLEECLARLHELRDRLDRAGVRGPREYNLSWREAMNFESMLEVSELLVRSALARTESRGSHYRSDFPQTDPTWVKNVFARRSDGGMELYTPPVSLHRVTPETISTTAGVAKTGGTGPG